MRPSVAGQPRRANDSREHSIPETDDQRIFRRGAPDRARCVRVAVIINVSSFLGQVGSSTAAAYVAAKQGVTGLTRSAAIARDRLRVVA